MSAGQETSGPRIGIAPLAAGGGGRAVEVAPVAGPLGSLLPEGLARGSTVAVTGSTSLALAVTGAVAADGWAAGVGWERVGLVAGRQLGVCWERLVLVAAGEGRSWAATVSSLLDGFDVVVVRPAGAVAERDGRRLSARARERGSLLVASMAAGGGWPSSEVRLRVVESRWEGLGVGWGHLRARRAVVEASGRGRLSRPRRLGLWLPAADGGVALAAPEVAALEVVEPRAREAVS